MNKLCKHCNNYFDARRKNHVYCSTSCKTMASYKRNNYKYISGHYTKQENEKVNNSQIQPIDSVLQSIQVIEEKINKLDARKETVNATSITNAATGVAMVDAAVYGAKKIFAPNLLASTKGDIENLRKEIDELKRMIQNIGNTFFQY